MPKQDNASKNEISSIENKVTNIKSRFWSSPGAKFIITGIITLLLLVPSMMVWGLVEERAERAENTASTIAKGWGGKQIINGPYLVVPYKVPVGIKKADDIASVKKRYVTRHAIYSPNHSEHIANIEVEERKKSIYTIPVYHIKSKISGNFSKLDIKDIQTDNGTPDFKNAYLAMGVSDTTGFRSQVLAKINDAASVPFEPGLKQMIERISSHKNSNYINRKSGINLPISQYNLVNGFEFEIDLALNGSQTFSVVPNGKNSKLNITSNWPHPGFDGQFLPETRDIKADGFAANWNIPNLARGVEGVQLSSVLPHTNSMIVNFVEPLKFYQLISRTLKYSIAFFSLVFLAVFILELMGKKLVHWIQYILVGLAMIVFYILLLALAEHIGFNMAYITSAVASTLLISWYVGASLGQKNGMAIMTTILGLIYAVVFLVLKEAEYALLAGALIAFFAIAITMYATRKVDWSAQQFSTEVKT